MAQVRRDPDDIFHPRASARDPGLGPVGRVGPSPARMNAWDDCCIARSGKLDRARSRLYRGRILQENMRLKALAEIYTMHSFAQLCNLNSVLKFRQFLFAKCFKIQKHF